MAGPTSNTTTSGAMVASVIVIPSTARARIHHATARLNPRQAWSPATARFYSKEKQRYFNALLDFVMASPELLAKHAPNWRIWHPFDDEACFANPDFANALLTASDHFPVSIDLKLGA